MKRVICLLGIPLLTTACATAPSAPPPKPVPCPVPPVLDQAVVPQESFTDRIAKWLLDSPEKPTKSGSPSSSATPSTKPSGSN